MKMLHARKFLRIISIASACIALFSAAPLITQAEPQFGNDLDPRIDYFIINRFLSDLNVNSSTIGHLNAVISVNGSPIVPGSKITLRQGETVTIDGLRSEDTTGATIISYQWDILLNGVTPVDQKTGDTIQFSWPAAASPNDIYQTRLTVTNSDGVTASAIAGANTEDQTVTTATFLTDSAIMFEFKACDPDDDRLDGEIVFEPESGASGGEGDTISLQRITCARWRVPHIFKKPGTYKATLTLHDAAKKEVKREIRGIEVGQLEVNTEKPRLICSVTPDSYPIVSGRTGIRAQVEARGLRYAEIEKFKWTMPSGGSCDTSGDKDEQVSCKPFDSSGEKKFTVSVLGKGLIAASATCGVVVDKALDVGDLTCSPSSVTIGADGVSPDVTCTIGAAVGSAVQWDSSGILRSKTDTTATFAFTSPGQHTINATVIEKGQTAQKTATIEVASPTDDDDTPPPPGGQTGAVTATFTINPTTKIAVDSILFVDGSSSKTTNLNATITKYDWTIQCGGITIQTLSTGQIEEVFVLSEREEFKNVQWPGNCAITLEVTDSTGVTATATKSIQVIGAAYRAEIILSYVPRGGMSGYIFRFGITNGDFLGATGTELAPGWGGEVRQFPHEPNVIEVYGADLNVQAQEGDVNIRIANLGVSSPNATVTLLVSRSCYEQDDPRTKSDVQCNAGVVDSQSARTPPDNAVRIEIVATGVQSAQADILPSPFDNTLAFSSEFATKQPRTALYVMGGIGALGLIFVSMYLFRKV